MIRFEDGGDDGGLLGPGTDLVISLAAILLLVLAIQSAAQFEKDRTAAISLRECMEGKAQCLDDLRVCQDEAEDLGKVLERTVSELVECRQRLGTVDLDEVRRNQELFIRTLAGEFPGSRLSENGLKLDIDGDGFYDISFNHRLARQRITFGGHVLFNPDAIELKTGAAQIVRRLGHALQSVLPQISEVHIEGHADTTPTRLHGSNLNLGAQRAITVFEQLRRSGVSPLRTVMSASSYGEHMPVGRFLALETGSEGFSDRRLEAENSTDSLKRRNRRIEILLIYSDQ